MANPEHVKRLLQGIENWNAWRDKYRETRPDLSHANLRGANLTGVDLGGANLEGVELSNADLTRANFGPRNFTGTELEVGEGYMTEADLREANLSNAKLISVNLHGANLSAANLSGASLLVTNLSAANLSAANLNNAWIGSNTFQQNDLRTTKGLVTINYLMPSYIELFSVQLPQDGSALHFLRGIGVPDEWINYYQMSAINPIQYYSCFISYTSKDEILAARLHADLQAKGVRCWFAPHDMKIGNKIRQHIHEAIHLQDKLLLLLSKQSIASTWVEDEVETALEKEKQHKREVLFPIRLDDTIMQTSRAWAATLRHTRHIGDFTEWKKPHEYQVAFERLLHDLKQN